VASNLPTTTRRTWLRPQSGLLILGVDWLFFGAEVLTFPIGGVVLAAFAAFTITASGVFWMQRRGGDPVATAAFKAMLAGAVAGIPTSVGGTVVGAAVLALAGLNRLGSTKQPPNRV
jgi:hypothetical protein